MAAVVAGMLATISLTGCVSRTEPLVEQLATNSGLEHFTVVPESTKGGCGGSNVFCADRQYEIVFLAPVAIPPDQICTDVFDLANRLGADGYSRSWDYPNVSRLAGNETSAQDFCNFTLSTLLTNWDATTTYAGMNLYSKGLDYGMPITMVLTRDIEDSYLLNIAFSRGSDDASMWEYRDEPATVLTQEELDEQNDFNKIAHETMQFAITVIGMTEAAAIQAIKDAGYSQRIAERDGKQFALTEDYSPQRINLLVRDNKVFDVWVG